MLRAPPAKDEETKEQWQQRAQGVGRTVAVEIAAAARDASCGLAGHICLLCSLAWAKGSCERRFEEVQTTCCTPRVSLQATGVAGAFRAAVIAIAAILRAVGRVAGVVGAGALHIAGTRAIAAHVVADAQIVVGRIDAGHVARLVWSADHVVARRGVLPAALAVDVTGPSWRAVDIPAIDVARAVVLAGPIEGARSAWPGAIEKAEAKWCGGVDGTGRGIKGWWSCIEARS